MAIEVPQLNVIQMPLPISGETNKRLSDEEYIAWERELENTFTGILLDEITKAEMWQKLYGRDGYFSLRGAASADEHGKLSDKPGLGQNAANKAQGLAVDIVLLLQPTLTAAEVPPDEQSARVDEMIEEFQKRYSGKANETKRRKESNYLKGVLGELAVRLAS